MDAAGPSRHALGAGVGPLGMGLSDFPEHGRQWPTYEVVRDWSAASASRDVAVAMT